MIFITCFILTLGLLGIFWKSLPPSVPLWYERPWGQDQLAGPVFLLIIPVLLCFTFLISLLLQKVLVKHEMIQKISNIMGITVQIILTLAYVRIILLML